MKKDAKKTRSEPRPLTKKQLSRYQRERELQTIALIGAAALAALVIGVMAFGLWREVLSKPGETVARVNGKPISAETYAKILGYTEYNYDLQIGQLEDYVGQLPASQGGEPQQNGDGEGGTQDVNDFLRQYAQQQLQQLQFRKYTLETEVLDALIDNELIRAEAARRGITITSEDLDKALMEQFAPSSTVTQTNPITSTEQTADPAQPVTSTKTITQVQDELRQALAQTGFLSEAEYRYYFLEASLLSERLQEAIGGEVKTSGEQVHASHILVDTEEDAKKAISKLKEEGRDFASVAKELSKDTQSKEKGGDLGWFPRGVMLPEFEEAAFRLSPGEVSDPVKTAYGYHVIRVEERQSDREYSPEYLDALKAKAFDDWLTKEKSPDQKKVEKLDLSSSRSWVRGYIDGKRKEMVARARQQAGSSGK